MPVDPDFGRTVNDYTTHRADFPEQLFEQLAEHGFGTPGSCLLDLGTGTGAMARPFAQRGCVVTGLDPSAEMLAGAARLAEQEELNIDWVQATAERTTLPDAAFDFVSAGQCWHWFDPPVAAAEVARVLRPEGQILIAQFDWLPLKGNLVEAVEELILKYSPDWHLGGATGVYPERFVQLGEAGFRDLRSFSFDLEVPYRTEAWRGRIRASAGVGGSLTPDRVAAFDDEHASLLATRFPGELQHVPHRIFALLARAPRSV